MRRHVLIIDNNNHQPCKTCFAFRRTIKSPYQVFRPTEHELPSELDGFTHIVLTGGGGSLLDPESDGAKRVKRLIKTAIRDKIPTLGICLGHELIIAALLGYGAIERHDEEEVGWVHIQRIGESRLLDGLPPVFGSFASHFNHLKRLPDGFHVIATSDRCKLAGYEHETLPIFGLQFHPEKSPRNALLTVLRHMREGVSRRDFIHPYSAKRTYRRKVAHQIFENFYSIKRS